MKFTKEQIKKQVKEIVNFPDWVEDTITVIDLTGQLSISIPKKLVEELNLKKGQKVSIGGSKKQNKMRIELDPVSAKMDYYDREIIKVLYEHKSLNTSQVADKLDADWETAKKHLHHLKDFGFVTRNEIKPKQGRTQIFWELN